jgi:hypothetical protein
MANGEIYAWGLNVCAADDGALTPEDLATDAAVAGRPR